MKELTYILKDIWIDNSIVYFVIVEVSKNLEMFMFLFDDILLLTKVKKPTARKV